jgi:hypothetical protein
MQLVEVGIVPAPAAEPDALFNFAPADTDVSQQRSSNLCSSPIFLRCRSQRTTP